MSKTAGNGAAQAAKKKKAKKPLRRAKNWGGSVKPLIGRLIIVLIAATVLGVLLFLCLLRAILGPRIADRVVGINMIGTIVIMMIAILALMLGEGYLVDIAIIYAMLSFLAVVVLAKIYIGVYLARKAKEGDENER